MPTTFATLAFKNDLIDSLTGRGASIVLSRLQPFNGVQPADPSVTPVGVSPFTGATTSFSLASFMSSPGGGVSQLSSAVSAVATSTVAGLTFARLFNTSSQGMIDVDVSLSGGGGGAILGALSVDSGQALTLSALSFKIPQSNGTIRLSDSLANAMVSAMCVTASNVALGVSGVIRIYSGAAPANANMAATGTLLVSYITGTVSPWSTAVGGAASMVSALAATGLATGTAGYARIEKGGMVLQGSVGTSGTDFIVDTVDVVSGNVITLSEATVSI